MLVSVHKLSVSVLFLLIIGTVSAQSKVWDLEQCIDTALVNNKNLKINKNNIQINEELNKEAWANYLPKVNFNTDYKYYIEQPTQLVPMSMMGGPEDKFKEVQMGVPHNFTANVQLGMPIYNSQISGAVEKTKIASEIARLQYKKTEEQLYYEISNLYYNALVMEQQINFIDSNLVNTERLHKNMQLLHSQLMVKGTDVDKIALQISQLKTQRDVVKSKHIQVINALKFSMGISPEEPFSIKPEIPYQNGAEYMLTSTLDMQLIDTQNKLLNSEVLSLKKSRLPSVSLFGSYGLLGYGYDKKPNEFFDFYNMGVAGIQLSVPLFNGTVTQRKIKQKNLEIENNKIQRDLINEQNAMQIENARNTKFTASQSIDNTTKQIELSKKVYNQTMLQQKEGTASLTDVLMADNSLRETQQSYLTALVDYLKADLEIKKLTGNILNN